MTGDSRRGAGAKCTYNQSSATDLSDGSASHNSQSEEFNPSQLVKEWLSRLVGRRLNICLLQYLSLTGLIFRVFH